MTQSLALLVPRRAPRRARWQSRLHRTASLRNATTVPLIYSLIIPLVLADVWLTAHQWICFPLYRISRVPRRRFFVLDRHKLAYLNPIEKLHCAYCSYANGLIAYIREIAARTEQYWCPIKHGQRLLSPHARYPLFVDYGDAAGYLARGPELRTALQPTKPTGWIGVSAGPRARTSSRRRAG
jgi:hypothetical protein